MPETLVSQDGFGSSVRVSLLISTLWLNLVLTYGIPPEFRYGVHNFKPPNAIGPVPSLSGHAIAYRWRSLPRVRWHRASKPQGYSRRVLPWQVTMDQLIFASLSHTHYWYEVGMLSVPAVYTVEIVRYSGTLNNGLPDIAVPKSTGTNTPRYSRIQPLYRTHPDIAAYHRYIELYILYYYCSCGAPSPAAHEHQHTNTQAHKHTNKQPPHTYTMRGWRAYDPT